MPTYAFNDAERYAVYAVHGEKCYMCGNPIDLLTMEVDHVIPEWLVDHQERLLTILKGYGLPDNFELNSFANWMPACPRCSNRKRGRVYRPTLRIQVELEIAAEKAPEAAKLAAATAAHPAVTKALNTLKRACAEGSFTDQVREDVQPLVEFHAQVREPEMAGKPMLLSPTFGVVSEKDGITVFRSTAGPSGPHNEGMRCGRCGNPYFNGIRCVMCGSVLDE